MPNAAVAVTSSEWNNVVNAPANGFLRVHGYVLTSLTAIDSAKWRYADDNAGTNAVTLATLYATAAQGGAVGPYCEEGWFDLPAGKYLGLTLSAAGTVGGHLKYSNPGGP